MSPGQRQMLVWEAWRELSQGLLLPLPPPPPHPPLAHNCTALGRSQKAFPSPRAGREVVLPRRELEPQSSDLPKIPHLVSSGTGTRTQDLQPSTIHSYCTIGGATCPPFGLLLVGGLLAVRFVSRTQVLVLGGSLFLLPYPTPHCFLESLRSVLKDRPPPPVSQRA